MISPKLKKGDKIGFIAPSNCFREERKHLFRNARGVIEKLGFQIEIGKNIFQIDKYGVSAGTPEQRAEDLNSFFGDKSIKAIWCVLGGDTAHEILDLIDYSLIRKNPKIFIGMSDISVLLNAITQKTNLVTFYGPDPKVGKRDEYFDSKYSQEEFVKRFVDAGIGRIRKVSDWKCVRKGRANGKLSFGHLGCTLKLTGTRYFPDVQDSILLLESYHDSVRDTIANLIMLKQLKVYEKIKGIIIGYVYGYQKEKQYDRKRRRIYFEDIVLDITEGYSFPILKIDEFGHKCPSTFLPIGGMGEMDAGKKAFKIIEECVR